MINIEPGTVFRLGRAAPVPVAWRGKTVICIGEKDGWVYHGRIYADIWFDKERRQLVIGNKVRPARCRVETWWHRLHDSTVDPLDYQLNPGALDGVIGLLESAGRTGSTADRTEATGQS